jgi:hypothetical protein
VPNHGSNPSGRPAHSQHGNRQTEGGTAASTYSISPSSNRITGITGALARTYAYDAADSSAALNRAEHGRRNVTADENLAVNSLGFNPTADRGHSMGPTPMPS